MKKSEIRLGGLYLAKVGGAVTTVRVDAIRVIPGDCYQTTLGTKNRFEEKTVYEVTNLRTKKRTSFRSAAKFRCEVKDAVPQPINTEQKVEDAISYLQGIEDTYKATMPTAAAEAAGEVYDEVTGEWKQAEGEQRPDPIPQQTVTDGATDAVSIVPSAACPTGNGGASDVAMGSLARMVVATRQQGRQVGSPVAGMTPNAEQEAILDIVAQAGLKVLVIGAGAGTGKTATLKMLEQVLPGRGQYTAFNSSLVAESKGKFTKAACNTTHSLAFRAVGRLYQHRLGGERMRSSEIARILGIDAMQVQVGEVEEYTTDAEGKEVAVKVPKLKTLRADFLAGQVLVAIRKFCQSADREIATNHFGYIDGIDQDHGRANNDKVRGYLLPFASKVWADLSSVNGQLPFNHDCYVKIWQLGQGNDRPIISADYILLDEAQDTAPVFLDVLKQQTHAMLVFVGDSNQAIYEWRGAVDAMKAYPTAERRLLSQSYRFGQSVADVANAVLATLEDPTDLVMRGMPGLPTRVAEVAEPRCYLYRTNAGALGRIMVSIEAGKRPCLMGTRDYVSGLIAWCKAAVDLQARPSRGTQHPELACFADWAEVCEYSKTDEGSDLRLMVKLITEFGAQEIADALRDMPAEEDADLVVSTAHKSKGREWDTVRLGPDFPLANKMGDADRRLLYVAATRAKLILDINDCPPFCGGFDSTKGESDNAKDWVPGLPITYTQAMPTEADLAAYMAGNAPSSPAAGRTPPTPAIAPTAAPVAPAPAQPAANGNRLKGRDGYSWASYNGGWYVRGPKGGTGQTVTVTKKSGATSRETLGTAIKEYDDASIYRIA